MLVLRQRDLIVGLIADAGGPSNEALYRSSRGEEKRDD